MSQRIIGALLSILRVAGQTTPAGRTEAPALLRAAYLLSQDDQISVRILEAPELAEKPLRIDASGFIGLALAGRVHAGGRTIEQLETELRQRLQADIRKPHVSVSIEEFRSQPVSVIGAVANPGVVQLSGHKTLAEVLSMVGGLKPDAELHREGYTPPRRGPHTGQWGTGRSQRTV